MKFNWVQRLYDRIKSRQAPAWYVNLMGQLQTAIIAALMQIGKEAINAIKDKIIETAQENISNEEKFKKVFNYAKSLVPKVKDSALNAIINTIVLQFKLSGRF
jgi:hypothetical protein